MTKTPVHCHTGRGCPRPKQTSEAPLPLGSDHIWFDDNDDEDDNDDDEDDEDADDDDKPRTVKLLQTKWNRLTAGGFDHLKLIALFLGFTWNVLLFSVFFIGFSLGLCLANPMKRIHALSFSRLYRNAPNMRQET